MKKPTVLLLLISASFTLLISISYTKDWLGSMNLPTGGSCVFSAETQKDPATRRVCLKGGCILYSEWLKMSDEERDKLSNKGV